MISDLDWEILRRTRLLHALPDVALETLVAAASFRRVEKDVVLFHRGDPAHHFFAVLDGWVKVSRDGAAGEEAVLEVFGRGETFAEAAMFMGGGYPATATIVEPSRLCRFSRRTFMKLGMEQPEICFTMLGAISRHLHQMVAEVEQLKTRNGEQRLANFLAGLCGKTSGSCEISLPYDKGLVAARLGMRPESLSRHLANLAEFGVHSNGHTVVIGSVERLLEFSEVAPLRRERSA